MNLNVNLGDLPQWLLIAWLAVYAIGPLVWTPTRAVTITSCLQLCDGEVKRWNPGECECQGDDRGDE